MAQNLSKTKSGIKGFTWMFFGTVFDRLSHIIIIGILARLLTPEEFGIVGIILIFVSFTDIFTQMGIGTALVQRKEINKNHISLGYSLSVLIGLFVGIIFYFLAPYIGVFFNLENLDGPIRFFCFFFPIKSMNSVSRAILQRELKYPAIVKSSSISYFFGYGFTSIILAFLGFGYWSLIYGQLAILIVSTIVLFYHTRPSFSINNTKETYKDILFFGSGFALDTYINFFADNTDNLIIGKIMGTSSLGIYSRAFQLFAIPASFFGGIYDSVLFPILSSKQSDIKKLSSFYIFSISFCLLVLFPLSLILIFNAKLIVNVLLGHQWMDVIIPFQVLTIGLAIRFGTKINKAFLKSLGLIYQGVYYQSIFSIMMLTFCLVGVYHHGIIGVAIGVLFATIINYIQVSFRIQKILNFNFLYFLKLHLSALINYLPIILIVSILLFFEYNNTVIVIFVTLFVLLPLLLVPLKNKKSLAFQEHNINIFNQVLNNSPKLIQNTILKLKRII